MQVRCSERRPRQGSGVVWSASFSACLRHAPLLLLRSTGCWHSVVLFTSNTTQASMASKPTDRRESDDASTAHVHGQCPSGGMQGRRLAGACRGYGCPQVEPYGSRHIQENEKTTKAAVSGRQADRDAPSRLNKGVHRLCLGGSGRGFGGGGGGGGGGAADGRSRGEGRSASLLFERAASAWVHRSKTGTADPCQLPADCRPVHGPSCRCAASHRQQRHRDRGQGGERAHSGAGGSRGRGGGRRRSHGRAGGGARSSHLRGDALQGQSRGWSFCCRGARQRVATSGGGSKEPIKGQRRHPPRPPPLPGACWTPWLPPPAAYSCPCT